MPADGRVKVKRDGPRGWHWIAASNFDPSKHELFDAPPAEQPAAPASRGPRRTRNPSHTEVTHADR